MNIVKFISYGTIRLNVCGLADLKDNSSFFACIHLVYKMKNYET